MITADLIAEASPIIKAAGTDITHWFSREGKVKKICESKIVVAKNAYSSNNWVRSTMHDRRFPFVLPLIIRTIYSCSSSATPF